MGDGYLVAVYTVVAHQQPPCQALDRWATALDPGHLDMVFVWTLQKAAHSISQRLFQLIDGSAPIL
jgi:hypothetical protein